MPRLQDVTKRIPFKYATYQVRQYTESIHYFIISFYDSFKKDATIGIINFDGSLDYFHPYEGVDLPDSKLIEVGRNFTETFNIMFSLLSEPERLKLNKKTNLYKFKGVHYIELDSVGEDRVLLYSNGLFEKTPVNKKETFIKTDPLFNLINVSDFMNSLMESY